MNRTYLVSFALVFSFPVHAALDLPQAIQYALEHSPVYDASRRNAEIAELQVSSALSRFLPSADAQAVQGVQEPVLGPNPPWTSQLGLTITETLYDNGQSYTQFKSARASRDAARLAELQARDQLSLSVARQFYQFSLATQLLEVQQKQHDLLEDQYRLMQSRYRQGLRTRQDFLRLKVQVQRTDLDLITSRDSIRASRTELKRLLGVEDWSHDAGLEFVPITPADQAPRGLPTEMSAIEKSYEYRLADIQKSINHYSVNLAERRYWPQLSVTAGAGYGVSNYLGATAVAPATTGPWSWNALLTLQYNLWDWGTRRRDVQVAIHQEAVSNDGLRSSVLSTRVEKENVHFLLKRLKQSDQLNRELLAISQESFDTIDANYRQGKSTYLDIINSLSDLLDAKTRVYNTYYSLLQNLAQYRYYEGTLYDSIASTDRR